MVCIHVFKQPFHFFIHLFLQMEIFLKLKDKVCKVGTKQGCKNK